MANTTNTTSSSHTTQVGNVITTITTITTVTTLDETLAISAAKEKELLFRLTFYLGDKIKEIKSTKKYAGLHFKRDLTVSIRPKTSDFGVMHFVITKDTLYDIWKETGVDQSDQMPANYVTYTVRNFEGKTRFSSPDSKPLPKASEIQSIEAFLDYSNKIKFSQEDLQHLIALKTIFKVEDHIILLNPNIDY